MQGSAREVLVALRAAADARDVEAAQAHLGDSAPGLRASGLRRASFPDVAAEAIAISQEGDLFVATAGTDRLTSADGTTWTFDYGDRPLAAYRPPAGEPVHDLWWVESDGEHHLYLRVNLVTLSRTGMGARLSWSFDPSRPDDATYFERLSMDVAFVNIDGVDVPIDREAQEETRLLGGVTTVTLDRPFEAEAAVGQRLILGVTVANPRSIGADPRLIDTSWTLTVR
jgi:hypothetical protein